MGKRYYCDYCDRSFIDDIQARKKHLKGTSHLRNRKLHYLERRDLKTLIEEESAKKQCYKFKTTGQCVQGENCFWSHFSAKQLQMFRDKLAMDEERKRFELVGELRTVDSWLQKRSVGIPQYESSDTNENVFTAPFISIESNFSSQLPPSLQRVNLFDYADTELSEWG